MEEGVILVSEVVRRDIIDIMRIAGLQWYGRLDDVTFLDRIYDLSAMPSYDGRFQDAAGDIWQHRAFNHDWDDDWVFSDGRFGLLHGDDEVFLRFLCEVLHPAVRANPAEVERLRRSFNERLAVDGYEITERTRLSGRPVFAARRLASGSPPAVTSLKKSFARVDAGYVASQITRMEAALESDPGLAIGTAKELVETCCRTILHERNVEIVGSPDLPALAKQTAKALSLVPEDIPEGAKAASIIKRLLSNLATITQGIAELRNHYGTGHGRVATARGLRSRHAKLAVGAASALALFLLETHEERRPPAD